jgi:hypothetical protein
MWWQSRDEQREELLDAVSAETAEVKPESEESNRKKSDPSGSDIFLDDSQTLSQMPAS